MTRTPSSARRDPSRTGIPCARSELSSAEKSSERSEQTTGEICGLLRKTWRLLSKRPLRTSMYLACGSWHLVSGQIDIVGASGRRASCGCELIGNRTYGGVLERHGWFQRYRWIMLCRFFHYLLPHWQNQSCGVGVWHDCCR